MDFSVSADHRVELKENEKRDKYLDLPRDFFKWIMKGTVMPIVIIALGTIPKRVFEIRGQVDTIQTMALLSSARILRSRPI